MSSSIPLFKYLNGLILSIIITIAAVVLSGFTNIAAVALAILIGAVIGNSIEIPGKYNKGITFAEKVLLGYAITFMGINLNFNILAQLGIESIILIVISIIVTIFSSLYIAKLMKFDKDFALILGIGNGVCGSAAIAATKDIVNLNKQKTALAVAIVNFLGTIAIFVLPIVGTFILNFSDVEVGILIGNTLQAVGHVIASGFSVSESAGQSATVVKMGRVLMLTPIVLFLIYYIAKRKIDVDKQTSKAQVPFFIWGFILFSIIATVGILPDNITDTISTTSKYLLIISMSAIGLKINLKTIKEQGGKAFILSSYVFIVQIIFSSLFIIVLL